jgi:hypothetical protein
MKTIESVYDIADSLKGVFHYEENSQNLVIKYQ